MKNDKMSHICFCFEYSIKFCELDIKTYKVYPDYCYQRKHHANNNVLYVNDPILHLSRLESPFNDLSYYFDSEKIRSLKSRVKDIFLGDCDLRLYIPNEIGLALQESNAQLLSDDIEKQIKDQQARLFLQRSSKAQILLQAGFVYHLKFKEKLTFRNIACTLNLSLNRVVYLWRIITAKNGNFFVNKWNKLQQTVYNFVNFKEIIDEILNTLPDSALTGLDLYFAVRKLDTSLVVRNYSHFYHLLKQNEFHYSDYKAKHLHKTEWSQEHKELAIIAIAEFIFNQTEFEIFWTDETTICPQNFKRKCWATKRKQPVICSNLTYSKTKIFGLMTRDKLFALQFLQGSNSQVLFDNFIIESMKRYLRTGDVKKIPVLFMDNSPIHKSKKITEFCRRNEILVVYNLPNCPVLNPIEILWRHLKQPFKKLHRIKKS
jgi:hypothetical protein